MVRGRTAKPPSPLAANSSSGSVASGAGLAKTLYKDAVLRARFEPEAHGLSARSAEAWRARFRLLEDNRVPFPAFITASGPLRVDGAAGLADVCFGLARHSENSSLCLCNVAIRLRAARPGDLDLPLSR